MIPSSNLYIFFDDYIYTNINTIPFIDEGKAKFSSNFDYEMLFDETKRISFDIGIEMDIVEITFRTAFEFDGSEYSWKDLFEQDFIFILAKRSVDNCYDAFIEFCDTNNIPIDHSIEIDQKVYEKITHETIEQYINYRSKSDLQHEYLINNVGLECETGTDTIATIKPTFAVLDEILYLNDQFFRTNNCEAFSDFVPLPRYNTIKINCSIIEIDNIELNFYDTILFFICLDCALQMLIGDKSDILISAIEKKGVDKEMLKTFFKEGTELFKQLQEVLKSTNTRILNFDKQPDWNSILQ